MRRLQTLQAVIGIVVVDYRVYRLIKPSACLVQVRDCLFILRLTQVPAAGSYQVDGLPGFIRQGNQMWTGSLDGHLLHLARLRPCPRPHINRATHRPNAA